MPEEEFRGWQFMYNNEPWGDRRLDYLFGMLAAVIANIHRGDSKQAYKASDFMQDWDALYQPVDRAAAMEAEVLKLQLFKQGYDRERELKKKPN